MFRNIILRVLLSPFALLYGLIILCINFTYDIGLQKSSKFSIPVIGVGNLSIGGTGKTPHIEYLIDLLKDYIDIATLSRGYKRNTKGFRLVRDQDTALTVGDEPLQFHRKFPDITVAVSESRAYAIPQILQYNPSVETILLDDAFQHRGVLPGLQLLLTSYDQLFTKDYLLPAGRLREWRAGATRADVAIVTKCPINLTAKEKNEIMDSFKSYKLKEVFFTYYEYSDLYDFHQKSNTRSLDKSDQILLLSAIANTDYLYDYLLPRVADIKEIEYTDHHTFDTRDIHHIHKVFSNITSPNKYVVTTEKDAMRLEMHASLLQKLGIEVRVLPIKVAFHFDEKANFDKLIKDFLLDFKA